jgi:hypothetical protein
MKSYQLLKKRLFMVAAAMIGAGTVLLAQQVRISIENPSHTARINEPVVIAWGDVGQRLRGAPINKLRLIDDRQRSCAFQIDDLDGDGTFDELAFTLDIGPKQTRPFLLTAKADTLPLPTGPFRTDIANYKRVGGVPTPLDDDDGPGLLRSQSQYMFDGIGWESELIGYRLYLDERNAVDIQAKRIPGLHWNYIGRSGVNYQLDAYWGMDVLHVGAALGVGGMGLWLNDSVAHPYKLERRRARAIARGPVRAVVRVDYYGWDLGSEKVDLTSFFLIYGGDRTTEHRVLLQAGKAPKILATGVVKHANAQAKWNSPQATLFTLGAQSRANDSLLMALTFSPSSVVKMTEDNSNHLVLLRLEQGKPLVYYISVYWQGESGGMWNEDRIRRFLENRSRRLNEPLRIQLN